MFHTFRVSHVVRLSVIFLMGFYLVLLIPVFPFGKISVIANPVSGLLLFIFLSGFLISQAIIRNKALQLSVSFELSHTRRIMHIVEQLDTNKKWKNTMKKSIVAYLRAIGSRDFFYYTESDALFRTMTHLIYAFVPKSDKDKILFGELLILSRELAFQRQELAHDVRSPISPYTWIVFFLVGAIDIFLLLLIRDASFISNAYSFFLIVGIFLIMDLLIELSGLSKYQKNQFQKLYVENSQRIDKE